MPITTHSHTFCDLHVTGKKRWHTVTNRHTTCRLFIPYEHRDYFTQDIIRRHYDGKVTWLFVGCSARSGNAVTHYGRYRLLSRTTNTVMFHTLHARTFSTARSRYSRQHTSGYNLTSRITASAVAAFPDFSLLPRHRTLRPLLLR